MKRSKTALSIRPWTPWCAAALCIISGCVSLTKPAAEKRYFAFDLERPGPPIEPVAATPLVHVEKPTISPPFAGRQFVYRLAELSYTSDFYNEFFVAPDVLLGEAAEKWLEAAGLAFAAAAPLRSSPACSCRLQLHVARLCADFRDRGQPKAVLDVQAFLTRSSPGNPAIVLQKTYAMEKPIGGREARDVMAGWNEAAIELLTALEADVRKVVEVDQNNKAEE